MAEVLEISCKEARLEIWSLRQRLPDVFIYSFSYLFWGILVIELRTLHMLGKSSTIKLYSQSSFESLFSTKIDLMLSLWPEQSWAYTPPVSASEVACIESLYHQVCHGAFDWDVAHSSGVSSLSRSSQANLVLLLLWGMTLHSGGSSYRSGWVTSSIKASCSSRGSLFHAFSGSLEEKEIEIDGSGRHLGSFFPWWLVPAYQGEITSWNAIYQVIHLLSFLLWEHVRSLGLSSNDSYG